MKLMKVRYCNGIIGCTSLITLMLALASMYMPAAAAPITIVSLSPAPVDTQEAVVQAIVLAGVAEIPDAMPPALFLAWVREDGGWFGPSWELQLHSQAT